MPLSPAADSVVCYALCWQSGFQHLTVIASCLQVAENSTLFGHNIAPLILMLSR